MAAIKEPPIDRNPLQAAANEKLNKLSDKHREQLIELMGVPPDISRVPETFWMEVDSEYRRQLAIVLAIIFLSSFDESSDDSDDGDLESEIWGGYRADWNAQKYVATSKKRLASLAGKWVVEPVTTRQELRTSLSGIFGPSRTTTIAQTETTRALTAGTVAAAKRDQQYRSGRLGIYNRLGPCLHCKFCELIADTESRFWSRFGDGPPWHVNCCCFLELVPMQVTSFFDMPDMSEVMDAADEDGIFESSFAFPERFLIESYCPNGPGGGIDPGCSGDGQKVKAVHFTPRPIVGDFKEGTFFAANPESEGKLRAGLGGGESKTEGAFLRVTIASKKSLDLNDWNESRTLLKKLKGDSHVRVWRNYANNTADQLQELGFSETRKFWDRLFNHKDVTDALVSAAKSAGYDSLKYDTKKDDAGTVWVVVDPKIVSRGGDVSEAFCATGDGGGIDNSCSSNDGSKLLGEDDCGTGAGGFKEGNTCAAGSGGGGSVGDTKTGSRTATKSTPIYRLKREEFMKREVDKEIKRLEAEREPVLNDLQEQVEKARRGETDASVVQNIRDNANMDPTSFYEHELKSKADEYNRKIDRLKAGTAFNWMGDVEERHAKAIQSALKQGKDVPVELLREYYHTPWMPKDKKDLVDIQGHIDEFQSAKATQEFRERSAEVQLRLAKNHTKLEAVRQDAIRFGRAAMDRAKALDGESERLAEVGAKVFNTINAEREKLGGFDVLKTIPEGDARRAGYDTAWREFKQVGEKLDQVGTEATRIRYFANQEVWKSISRGPGTKFIPIRDKEDAPRGSAAVHDFLSTVVSAKHHGESLEYKVRDIEPDSIYGKFRAYARPDTIHIQKVESPSTIAHELGHVLDHRNENRVAKLSKAFLMGQTKDDPAEHLGATYRTDEVFSKDKFSDRYAGKFYPHESSEVLSMGVQLLFEDAIKFAEEAPDHFRYTVGVLRGDLLEDAE